MTPPIHGIIRPTVKVYASGPLVSRAIEVLRQQGVLIEAGRRSSGSTYWTFAESGISE